MSQGTKQWRCGGGPAILQTKPGGQNFNFQRRDLIFFLTYKDGLTKALKNLT